MVKVLPAKLRTVPGVHIRTTAGAIAVDQQLKLRIVNATHTALVYVMALAGFTNTTQCTRDPVFIPYLTRLFETAILPAAVHDLQQREPAVRALFAEWMMRLQNPTMGMDTLFVLQNATVKLGARIMPSVPKQLDSAHESQAVPVLAMAFAAALRFLTPMGDQPRAVESVFQVTSLVGQMGTALIPFSLHRGVLMYPNSNARSCPQTTSTHAGSLHACSAARLSTRTAMALYRDCWPL